MKFYNTLHRKKEKFISIKKNNVGLYTCGPTVYNYAHIGNFRAYIIADILQRYLRFNSYNVKWVMNITDVDDKTIRDSEKEYPKDEPMNALGKLTKKYEKAFWQDTAKLNIKKSDFHKNPRATETIEEMQKLILKIIDKDYAYIKDGSIYFDVKKYSKKYKYGQLLNLDMAEFKAEARINVDEYEKENIQDFVLWKTAKKGEPSWDFEINGENLAGRPGWHIECSAMSEKYLGKKFDIHTGGVDLKFPHHENEIAQSAVGFGATPANFWMHNEYLQVDGGKMSKSKNNFYTLADLEKKLSTGSSRRGFNPLSLRYLMLTASYRMPLNFTWEALEASQNALERLYDIMRELQYENTKLREHENKDSKICKIYLKKFLSAVNDDLNMPEALAVVWKLVKDSKKSDAIKHATLLEFDKVLGLGLDKVKKIEIPEKIKKLAKERDDARVNKDWHRADELREKIEKMGFGIEDGDDGAKIVKL